MNSLPIRVRLTVWYFAMFATAASVLCVASLWMLRRSVEETEYYDLQERAEDVEALLSHETPNRTLQQIGGDLEAIYRFKDDGKYLQVRDEQGNWIFRSKRMIAENPPSTGSRPTTKTRAYRGIPPRHSRSMDPGVSDRREWEEILGSDGHSARQV